MFNFINFFSNKICKHIFDIKDIKATNIPPLAKPSNKDFRAWSQYYTEVQKHPSHTKKVQCKCLRCKNIFYSHCGLDLPGKLTQLKPGEVDNINKFFGKSDNFPKDFGMSHFRT